MIEFLVGLLLGLFLGAYMSNPKVRQKTNKGLANLCAKTLEKIKEKRRHTSVAEFREIVEEDKPTVRVEHHIISHGEKPEYKETSVEAKRPKGPLDGMQDTARKFFGRGG